jgi:hypothetical protein
VYKYVRATSPFELAFGVEIQAYLTLFLFFSHFDRCYILSFSQWSQTSSSKEWKYPSSILECVSSHLRSCTILNFDGSANDLRFARYILQNASLLENMKINVTTNGVLLEKSQIIELSSCPMISPTCKLSFGDK